MFGSLKIDGQEKGMWWDSAWGGSGVLKPPAQDELIQWLYDYSGDFVLLDKKQAVTVPDVVGVNALDFASAGTITAAGIRPTDSVTHQGSSVITAGDGVLNVGVGSVSDIHINDQRIYPAQEGDGVLLDPVSGPIGIGRTVDHSYSSAGSSFVRIGNTNYSSLVDAVAAVSAGETILLGDGEYPVTSTILVPDDVTICGHLPAWDNGFSPLGTHITCGGTAELHVEGSGVVLKDFGVSASGANTISFRVASSGNRMENIIMDGNGIADHGTLCLGDGNEIYNCTTRNVGFHGVAVKGLNHRVDQCDVVGGSISGIVVAVGGGETPLNETSGVSLLHNDIACDSASPALIFLGASGINSVMTDINIHYNKCGGDDYREAFCYKLEASGDGSSLSNINCGNNTFYFASWGHYSRVTGVGSSITANLDVFYYDDVGIPNGGETGGGVSIITFTTSETMPTEVNYDQAVASVSAWTGIEGDSANLRGGFTPALSGDGASIVRLPNFNYTDSHVRIRFRYKNNNDDETAIIGTRDTTSRQYRFGRLGGQWMIRVSGTGNQRFGTADIEPHTVDLKITGTLFECYIDDALGYSSTIALSGVPTIPPSLFAFALEYAGYLYASESEIFYVEDVGAGSVYVPLPNGQGLIEQGSGAVLSNLGAGDFATLNIPSTSDGVDARYGLPIGVKGSVDGEREHNGCEVGFRATDAWFSDPANIPNVYHDGTNPIDRYYSDMIAHPNGKYGMYQKSEKDTGTLEMCILKESGQYPTDLAPTPEQYTQGLKYWTVCDSFADPLVPYPINSGDGIGPSGGWYPIDGDKVYLVEDV